MKSMIDAGIIPCLLARIHALRGVADIDASIDNVSLSVQILGLLGKFFEAQERMDALGVSGSLFVWLLLLKLMMMMMMTMMMIMIMMLSFRLSKN